MDPQALKPGSLATMVRPPLRCKNGATVSVQAGPWHYSSPRDKDGPYTHFEIGFPYSALIPSDLAPYGSYDEASTFEQMVYGYVPKEVVLMLIEINGGLVDPEIPAFIFND